MKKLTFEQVKSYVEENGCELLSEEYQNNCQILLFKCSCGNTFERNFKEFKTKKKCCLKCSYTERGLKTRKRGIVKCAQCGKEIEKKLSLIKDMNFCNQLCYAKWKSENYKGENNPSYKGNDKIVICDHCGKEIKKLNCLVKDKNFCDKNCYSEWLNTKRTKCKCDYCGKEIIKANSLMNKRNFCSSTCMGKWMSENLKGENNPFYNPNLTYTERMIKRNYTEYHEFVKEVFERDKYTCANCGQHGGSLQVHHLNGYNWDKENRVNPNNGVTLCNACHKEFHSLYGYGNNTKEQYEEWISK